MLGQNGIISRSKEAVDEYEKSRENELTQMNEAEKWFEEQMNGGNSGGNEGPALPDGWDGNKVDPLEDGDGNILPLPKDFEEVEGDKDTGFVIKAPDGSEFVWIPVDSGTITRHSWAKLAGTYDLYEDDATETHGLAESVSKYKGFYVARYQASYGGQVNGSEKANSKKSTTALTTAWTNTEGRLRNYISWPEANLVANNYAEQIEKNTVVTSTLLTGGMWDEMCKFIAKEPNPKDVENDSSAWGNYVNNDLAGTGSVLANTGSIEQTKAKNIYDVAGNLWEWTKEKYTTYCAYRGGNCGYNGSTLPAAYRSNGIESDSGYSIGFRLALYVAL